MKVLVAGASGMLGSDVTAALISRGHETIAPTRADLDLAQPESVAQVVAEKFGSGIAWCVNCAAYTAVDRAESEESTAMSVNGLGPAYLARACAMRGIRLLHVSTDFVFDGQAREPYREDAAVNPLGVYGRSKLKGEEAVLGHAGGHVVVRTAWLYGPNGNSFPRTIIRAWLAGKPLRVVSDQIGSPTYTADLATVMVELLEKEAPAGLYHAAGPEAMSWHELAWRAIEAFQRVRGLQDSPVEIEAIDTAQWPTPARRPAYSVLSFEKAAALGIAPMRPVSEALAGFCRRLPEVP